MTRQKVGLLLFWFGVAWAIIWGIVIGRLFVTPAFQNLTTGELNQTMWALEGPLFLMWGVLGVPLGALLAGIGVLLNAGGIAWKYGGGLFLVFSIGLAGSFLGHKPWLFGVGGTIILLSFLGILWFWAEERKTLAGVAATAADLKLMGYVFIVIGAWFTCGALGKPFLLAVRDLPPSSPVHIIVFTALGWLFLALGHYKLYQHTKTNSGE
ncbi:hypothetical protein ACFL6E_03625 [Candidatus Neomarinimicrobiota bacterium]